MSELYESVVNSIKEFSWSNYGLDAIEFAIDEDLGSQDWISDLAEKIDRDWGEYVDRI
jgi:hypothetical protein